MSFYEKVIVLFPYVKYMKIKNKSSES